MENVETLMADLEGRGIRLRLRPDGKLGAGPPEKVTNLDRVNIARYKPDLVALLTRRSQPFRPAWYQSPRGKPGPHPKDSAVHSPGLSAANAGMVSKVVEAFDGQVVSVGPPRSHTPTAPDAAPSVYGEDAQPSLCASDPPPDHPGESTEPGEEQPSSDADSTAEPNLKPGEPSQPVVAEASESARATHDRPEPFPDPPAVTSEPPPPAPASANDPAQTGNEFSTAPTGYPDAPEPVYYPQEQSRAGRSERVVLWVTVERLLNPRTGQRLLRLKLTPSPSTDPDGVRFALQELHESKLRRLVDATELEQDGIRVTRPTPGLRLGIEVWR